MNVDSAQRGEISDRLFDSQAFGPSGSISVISSIIHRNTVYFQSAVAGSEIVPQAWDQ